MNPVQMDCTIPHPPFFLRYFWTLPEMDLETPWEHNYINRCEHAGREQESRNFENADFRQTCLDPPEGA